MHEQLALMETPPTDDRLAWQLDRRTRELGRRGVAAARAALAAPTVPRARTMPRERTGRGQRAAQAA